MTKKAQLEALEAAISQDLPVAEAEPEQPEPEVETVDEPEADPAVEAEPDGEPEPETEGEPETDPETEGEPEPKPEAKAEPEPEPEKEKRPSDEFGGLPKDAKQETRERFEAMRSRYDELHGKYEAEVERNTAMVEVVKRTGATGEQFDATLQYLGARNSNNPALLEQAYNIIKAEYEEISKKLGKSVPGLVDPLADQADLLEAVESGEISRKHAEELAAARTTRKLQDGFSATQTESQQKEQVLAAGYQAISDLGKRIRTENPAKYNAHVEVLKSIARLVENSGRDPREWAGIIEAEYSKLPDVAPAPAPKPKTPVPIRPTGLTGAPGGSRAHKEPGTAMEALDMALGI